MRHLLTLLLLAAAAPGTLVAQAADSVASHFTDFGLRLLGAIATNTESRNVFISPLSAGLALSAVLPGAEGETKAEMETALGMTGDQMSVIAALQKRLTGQTGVTLRIGTSVWVDKTLPLRSEYRKAVAAGFAPSVEVVDFEKPAAAAKINAWAKAATDGRILKVVEETSKADKLILANAVYFKGDWLNRFDTALTRPDTFTTSSGSRSIVPFMQIRRHFRYWETDSLQGIILPYKGSQFSALIILPRPGLSPREILPSLSSARLGQWRRAIGATDVQLRVPRVELKGDYDLRAALQSLGIRKAFSVNDAEFGALSPEPLFISAARQATFLKVNEEGSEAAAVTTVGLQIRGGREDPHLLLVNRPFLMGIVEQSSGELLFIGLIGQP